MTHFKTSKAELLFVSLPKGIGTVLVDRNQLMEQYSTVTNKKKGIAIELPQGNWQLIGKLSEVSEEVAKRLVDDDEIYECYFSGFEKWIDIYKDYNNSEPMPYGVVFTAIESLTSIATHLGMELTDNIYILKRI